MAEILNKGMMVGNVVGCLQARLDTRDGWGWYYLSTVLDDYARYIVAWLLRTSMQTSDVTDTLDLARAKTGLDHIRVIHRPRLLSDNGPCYVSRELADY